MATKQLVETSLWADKWFRALPLNLQLLFIYLFTNPQNNPAGLYEIDTDYIMHRFNIKDFKTAFKTLEPKVLYDEKYDIIWMVNYFLKNSKGPKIRKAVENSLNKFSKSVLVKKFIEMHQNEEFQLDGIQYRYPIAITRIEHNDNEHEHEHEHENENENENENEHSLYAKSLLNLWNSLGLKKWSGTPKQIQSIDSAFKNFPHGKESLRVALENYSTVLNNAKSWYTYKFSLDTFIKRGHKDFLEENFELGNYIRKSKAVQIQDDLLTMENPYAQK